MHKPRASFKVDPERAKELRERAAQHKKTIAAAEEANKAAGRRGKVGCAKLPHYRSPAGETKTWPNREGYANVNVCSSSKTWRELSPMLLGPIEHQDDHTDGVVRVTNLENLWYTWTVRRGVVQW